MRGEQPFAKLLKNPLHIYGEKEGVSITPFLKKFYEKEIFRSKCGDQASFACPPKQKITFNADLCAHRRCTGFVRYSLNVIRVLAFSIVSVVRKKRAGGRGSDLAPTSRWSSYNLRMVAYGFTDFSFAGTLENRK